MSKVVSVSGAAGTGKSTLLGNLPYRVNRFQVARGVLNAMKMDLYDILKDPFKTIEFQEEILRWKIDVDSTLHEDNEVEWTFVERCPADFYAFAKTWQPRFNSPEFDVWIEGYYSRCFDAMKYYDVAIIIPPGKFAHVDDGVRAKADTQETTHTELDKMLSRRWGWANFARPCFHFHRLESCDIIDRVNEVKNALNEATNYFSQNYANQLRTLSDLRPAVGHDRN